MHELSGYVVFVFVGFSQDFCDGVDVSRLIRALLSPFFLIILFLLILFGLYFALMRWLGVCLEPAFITLSSDFRQRLGLLLVSLTRL